MRFKFERARGGKCLITVIMWWIPFWCSAAELPAAMGFSSMGQDVMICQGAVSGGAGGAACTPRREHAPRIVMLRSVTSLHTGPNTSRPVSARST